MLTAPTTHAWQNETPDTIWVRNFNEVTLHHNSEGESFFVASCELVVPTGGHFATDDNMREDPRGQEISHMTHNHHKQQYPDKYNTKWYSCLTV